MNSIYENEKLYYIGGIVRDELLDIQSRDIDITFQGNAIEFCRNLEMQNVGQILQVNEKFGTVRMIIDGKEIDFASTRDETYPQKGHLPVVSDIGCDLKKDVLRRDFSVNALAKSLKTGEIIDYTGGLKDIKNKTLRILHDNSFIDDPTRIVRGLKFSVRFGFKLDEHSQNLQNDYLNNINYDMSYKRLKKELTETFNLNSQKAFDMFFEQNIYKLLTPKTVIKPECNIEKLVNKYKPQHIWLVYLGWMDLSKLQLTKEEQTIIDEYKELMNLQIKPDDFNIYKTFENKKPESILLYTIMTQSQKGLRFFEIKDIKIILSGEDLKKMGIKPSPKYKECFDFVLGKKLSNPDMTADDEKKAAKIFFKKN